MQLLPMPHVVEIKEGALLSKKFNIVNKCNDKRIESAVSCLEVANDGILLVLECGDGDGESYILDIDEKGIAVCGEGARGVFYGIQTLKQLMENAEVPYLHIEDAPDMSYRGFYHDVTRGRVPTVDSIKRLIDEIAYYKMNSLQLYIEHTFPFKEFGDRVEKFGYLTADEIREIDDYCYNNFIELIPSIATFGHLYELLQLEEFKGLQAVDNYEQKYHFWIERMGHHTIDPLNGSSIEVIKSLIDQFLPLFRSDKFNICCDETFDLKRGKHAELDTGALYIEFVKKIIAHVKENGKKVMMWGDIVLQHPEKIGELPSDVEMLNWHYSPTPRESTFEVFANAGFTQITCPGTGTWNRFVESIDASSKNICNMLDFGYKYGAYGMLNTNWGDWGNPCSIELSMHGFALGAAKSWNRGTENDDAFNDAACKLLYKNSSAVKILESLDRVSDKIPYRTLVRCYSNIISKEKIEIEFPQPNEISESVEECKNIILALEDEKLINDEYRREMIVCAKALIVTGKLLAKLAGYGFECQIDTFEWLKEYRSSWLARNKESELSEIERMYITLENK